MENQLADLPEAEEAVGVQPTEAPPVEELPPEESVETKSPVDEPPDASALEAQVKALEEKRQKLEEDAKYWREQKIAERARFFREKKGEIQPETPPEPIPNMEPPPQAADFDDFAEYVEKKAQYEAKFAVTQARQQWEQQEQQRQQNTQIQQKEAELQAKLQRGFEKYEDFEDVALVETVPITPTIKEILMDSEMPEDVAYYLGKNRADAIRISRLSPYQAAREIAKIEMGMTQTPSPNKKISNAPPPTKPVGSFHEVSKDPNKMTQAEYEAWRKSQGAKPY